MPIVTVSTDGATILLERGMESLAINYLNTLADQYRSDKRNLNNEMKSVKSWSAYDEARAERQVKIQALEAMKDAIEMLRKRK